MGRAQRDGVSRGCFGVGEARHAQQGLRAGGMRVGIVRVDEEGRSELGERLAQSPFLRVEFAQSAVCRDVVRIGIELETIGGNRVGELSLADAQRCQGLEQKVSAHENGTRGARNERRERFGHARLGLIETAEPIVAPG